MDQGIETAQNTIDANVKFKIPKDNLRDLMDFDKALRKKAGLSILTPDARVLFWISMNGSATVSDVMAVAETSYASFFTVLKRLKASRLIAAEKDDHDSRVRRLFLSGAE